jgi:ABC-type glutathione transport system ATPase component
MSKLRIAERKAAVVPDPSDAALLEVAGVGKAYASVVALDQVSLQMSAGTSLGIVGESGSGKSTLARIVVGLETADRGHVRVEGQDRTDRPRTRSERLARARQVQMVFQDPYLSLDPRVPVFGSIDEVLRLHSRLDTKQRHERIRELLDQVGLGERERAALPRHLSGGQRQRVAIARALAAEPRLLVLDEAVSALDVSIQAQILVLLDEIRRARGVAYLFVSHDLAVVRSVTDEVVVLRQGRVVEKGPTEQVLADPQQPYTRLLLASVPRRGWDLAAIGRARRALQTSG